MTLESHLLELNRRHAQLENAIEAELNRPGSDDLRIGQMKKEKLAIKDEIERLTH